MARTAYDPQPLGVGIDVIAETGAVCTHAGGDVVMQADHQVDLIPGLADLA